MNNPTSNIPTESEIMQNWQGDIDTPVVSVCTITYNHEAFIAEAIGSFLMQKINFPFEIDIDDDCSTDNNQEVIRQYAEKYPKIIRANLRKKNIGVYKNYIENHRWASKYLLKANLLDKQYQQVVGFRNKITHEYFGIDADEIWDISFEDLTEYMEVIRKHINAIDPLLRHKLIEAFKEDNSHLEFVVSALEKLHHD